MIDIENRKCCWPDLKEAAVLRTVLFKAENFNRELPNKHIFKDYSRRNRRPIY